jgi:hypothetical protein
VWLGAQFGFSGSAIQALDELLRQLGPGLHLPRMFNLAAWQFLFVCGVLAGERTARLGDDGWRRVFRPSRIGLLSLSLILLVTLAAMRLLEQIDSTQASAAPLTTLVAAFDSKTRLGLVQLVTVGAVTWTLGWLTIAASRSPAPVMRGAGGLVRSVLSWSFLQRLGRCSLRVYVWHVVLVYFVLAFDGAYGPFPEWLRTLLAALAMMLLALPTLRLRGAARSALGGGSSAQSPQLSS